MPRKGAIEVEGAVVEVLSNKLCRVELSNGHRVLAFAAGKASPSLDRLAQGDRVWLEMSPCDLSSGRLIVKE